MYDLPRRGALATCIRARAGCVLRRCQSGAAMWVWDSSQQVLATQGAVYVQGHCLQEQRLYKRLPCLQALGPLQEHTTFRESLVCYTSPPGGVYVLGVLPGVSIIQFVGCTAAADDCHSLPDHIQRLGVNGYNVRMKTISASVQTPPEKQTCEYSRTRTQYKQKSKAGSEKTGGAYRARMITKPCRTGRLSVATV